MADTRCPRCMSQTERVWSNMRKGEYRRCKSMSCGALHRDITPKENSPPLGKDFVEIDGTAVEAVP